MQSSDSPKNADTSLNWRRSDPVIKNDDDVQNTTFANMAEFENYLKQNHYELHQDKSTHTIKNLLTQKDKIMPKDCELFIGKLPKDCNEDIIFPILANFGRIHEFRVMMDFQNINRGFAFVTYCNKDDATAAINKLNNYQIAEGKNLGVCRSVDNRRLFVGGLVKSKNEDDILSEMQRISVGVIKVIAYRSVMDKSKNRGFAFVEYESHKAAAMARRKLIDAKPSLWGRPIAVDWAEPEIDIDDETMRKVKNLYVRNLMADTTEETLERVFSKVVGEISIERIKMIKDYAFIHFDTRENAEKAKKELHGSMIDGSEIDIHWAKPVDKDAYAAYLSKKTMDKQEKRSQINGQNNNNNIYVNQNYANKIGLLSNQVAQGQYKNFAAAQPQAFFPIANQFGFHAQNFPTLQSAVNGEAQHSSSNNNNNNQTNPTNYVNASTNPTNLQPTAASFFPGNMLPQATYLPSNFGQFFMPINSQNQALANNTQTLGIQYVPMTGQIPAQTATTKTSNNNGQSNANGNDANQKNENSNQNDQVLAQTLPLASVAALQNQIYNFQNPTLYAAQSLQAAQAPASIGNLQFHQPVGSVNNSNPSDFSIQQKSGGQNFQNSINSAFNANQNNNKNFANLANANNNNNNSGNALLPQNSQTKIKRGAGGIRAVGTRKYLDKKVNQNSSSSNTTAALGLNASLASKAAAAAQKQLEVQHAQQAQYLPNYASVAAPQMLVQQVYLAAPVANSNSNNKTDFQVTEDSQSENNKNTISGNTKESPRPSLFTETNNINKSISNNHNNIMVKNDSSDLNSEPVDNNIATSPITLNSSWQIPSENINGTTFYGNNASLINSWDGLMSPQMSHMGNEELIEEENHGQE